MAHWPGTSAALPGIALSTGDIGGIGDAFHQYRFNAGRAVYSFEVRADEVFHKRMVEKLHRVAARVILVGKPFNASFQRLAKHAIVLQFELDHQSD